MYKLSELYSGSFIVILIVLIVLLAYHYKKKDNEIKDLNGDGVIDQSEIEYQIKKQLEERAKQPPSYNGIIRSSLSGALRGTLMGFLLGGSTESAISGCIVLGIINPIVTSLEFLL